MAKTQRTTAGRSVSQRVVIDQLRAERDDLQLRIQGLLEELERAEAQIPPQPTEMAWALKAQAALNSRAAADQLQAERRAEGRGYRQGEQAGVAAERRRQFEEACRALPTWLVWLLRHFGQNLASLQGPAYLSELDNQRAMWAAVEARLRARSRPLPRDFEERRRQALGA